MLREARGMRFADGGMCRGLEVGGRQERMGVEEPKSADKLTDIVRAKEKEKEKKNETK